MRYRLYSVLQTLNIINFLGVFVLILGMFLVMTTKLKKTIILENLTETEMLEYQSNFRVTSEINNKNCTKVLYFDKSMPLKKIEENTKQFSSIDWDKARMTFYFDCSESTDSIVNFAKQIIND